MTYQPADLVEVLAWDRTVGAVAAAPGRDWYVFEYDPDWADGAIELSPLHLPNRRGPYEFPDLERRTFHGLAPLLADSLPDRFGNALVDAWLADQGIAPAQVTPLDRLAYMADRGMGALTFRPPLRPAPETPTALQLADLVTAARTAVRGDVATSETTQEALRQLIQVGTSAGGARAKAVIAFNPATGQIRSGQLTSPEGFQHWLVKLDGVGGDPTREVSFADGGGYGRIEYAYHLMARAAGIDMAECRLLPEGPRTHFLTRRFDRGDDGSRTHVLTLCGLAHLDFNMPRTHSYSQYLHAVDALGLGPDAREQAFRRVVFNVAAVNRDDHTKNLAFVMAQDGSWGLAPAYDLIYAHNPSGKWTAQHQMSVNGKFEGVTHADLREFGDRHLVPGFDDAIADVLGVVARWPEFAESAGVPGDVIHQVGGDIAAHRPA